MSAPIEPSAPPAPSALSLATAVHLNDGTAMPLLGFGTYQIANGGACYRAVRHALDAGYRHIDTAAFYGNEEDVGRAVRDSGIPRAEIYVTTKLWNSDQGYDSALRAFDRSLKRLALDYVDLYLVHWPEPGKRRDSWRALEAIRRGGHCRSIGVSNYTVRHLKELLSEAGVVPVNNQVEFSPFLFQRELLAFCADKGISLTAYCPLTNGVRLKDPALVPIARKHGRTTAQVLIRWSLQHNVVTIPKSARTARIDENVAVYDFELDAGDMATLDGLNEDYRTTWDPTDVR